MSINREKKVKGLSIEVCQHLEFGKRRRKQQKRFASEGNKNQENVVSPQPRKECVSRRVINHKKSLQETK